VPMEFPDLRKWYWGRHFWARGYFCTTRGNITDDVILSILSTMNLPASAGSGSVNHLVNADHDDRRTVSPSILAIFMLITRSILLGCWNGSSPAGRL